MSPARLREAIATAAETLAGAGIDSARVDAELLAAYAAGTERGRLILLEGLDEAFFERFAEAVAIRARRVPLQYITGTAAFGPVRLRVGPGVFIPRPETEALLEWVLAQILPPAPVVMDLCTGSGALALALTSALTGARVIAVEDDPAALEYARRNTVSTSVELIHGDATDPGLLPELTSRVDLVVANPPYVPCGAELDPEVAGHDPSHALFGGEDGMAVIAPLVRRAADWLKPGGLFAIEHDDTTSPDTVAALGGTGLFAEVTPRRDLAGRPRFVTARRTGAFDRGGQERSELGIGGR